MTDRFAIIAAAIVWCCAIAPAEGASFDPDTDPSRISWMKLATLGPIPPVSGDRFGAVIKTYNNGYWRKIAGAYRRRAIRDGVKLDIQSTPTELSPERQLAILETMLGGFYQAILISPQLAANLEPGIEDAIASNVPLVDVDGAVSDSIQHFVGAVNHDIGAKVAAWFIAHYPAGGKVAAIKGIAGVLGTEERSAGFADTLARTGRFQVVAAPAANWDRKIAAQRAAETLAAHSDLIGFYCSNDVMALGVMDVVKSMHLQDRVRVFGTDGTSEAYASVEAGEMTGTVDIFPSLTGAIAIDVAERLAVGQTVPRVVETPITLVTIENAKRYQGDPDEIEKMLIREAGPTGLNPSRP